MIFNTYKDIETDLKNKISEYIKISNDTISDMNNIISIIRTYLYEMKIINEISEYKVEILDKNRFIINIEKNDTKYKFEVSVKLEIRNLKINKLKSHDIIIKYLI